MKVLCVLNNHCGQKITSHTLAAKKLKNKMLSHG